MQPILEVLVGKTVEQALLEVMEEEELAALRQQQVRVHVSSIKIQQHPEEPFSKTELPYVRLS